VAKTADVGVLDSKEDTKGFDLFYDGVDLLAGGELAEAELLLAGFGSGFGSEGELDLGPLGVEPDTQRRRRQVRSDRRKEKSEKGKEGKG
jgi:hypothetical protein